MELVSVLMCVCNEPLEWVDISLKSIIGQTYKNLEIVIVVDSPDREEIIVFLKDYTKIDKRILLVFNPKNIGLTKSLNKGLSYCTGKFVARMDSDDISVKNRIERQLSYLLENDDICLCGGNIIEFNESRKFVNINYPFEQDEIMNKLILEPSFAHPVIMFNRKRIEKILGKKDIYDEDFLVAQDYKLYVDILGLVNFGNIPEILLYYRRSNNQITIKRRNEQIQNAKKCRTIALSKLIGGENTFYYRNIKIVTWLSKSNYNLVTILKFVISFDWLHFNGRQLLAFSKRFLLGPNSLIE